MKCGSCQSVSRLSIKHMNESFSLLLPNFKLFTQEFDKEIIKYIDKLFFTVVFQLSQTSNHCFNS